MSLLSIYYGLTYNNHRIPACEKLWRNNARCIPMVDSDLHWPTSTLVTFRTSCFNRAGWPIQPNIVIQVASDQRSLVCNGH